MVLISTKLCVENAIVILVMKDRGFASDDKSGIEVSVRSIGPASRCDRTPARARSPRSAMIALVKAERRLSTARPVSRAFGAEARCDCLISDTPAELSCPNP